MNEAEAGKEIRRCVDTGKVSYGFRQAEKQLLTGSPKLVIVSVNAPQRVRDKVKHFTQLSSIPAYSFAGNGLALGAVCGKPFTISVLLVLDEGKSQVLKLAEQKETVKKK
ncbi:MAG: 50S ribosomal protein L30e [Candidatus Diapherotrites archaeon]